MDHGEERWTMGSSEMDHGEVRWTMGRRDGPWGGEMDHGER